MNQLSTAARSQIIRCLVEGNSIRATERLTGHTKKAITVLANWQMKGVGNDSGMDFSRRDERARVGGVQNEEGKVVEVLADGTTTELARFRIVKDATLIFCGKQTPEMEEFFKEHNH